MMGGILFRESYHKKEKEKGYNHLLRSNGSHREIITSSYEKVSDELGPYLRSKPYSNTGEKKREKDLLFKTEISGGEEGSVKKKPRSNNYRKK